MKPYDQIAEEDLLNSGNRFPEITERRVYRVERREPLRKYPHGGNARTHGGAYKIGDDQGKWGNYIDLNSYKYSTEYWRGRLG